MRTLAAVILIVVFGGSAVRAQTAEARAKALIAKYAGSDYTDALLAEPAVKAQLTRLLGSERKHLTENLFVRGPVDLLGGALAVSGNAAHRGTEEEAVVCVAPIGPVVQAAILSNGTITVYAADP